MRPASKCWCCYWAPLLGCMPSNAVTPAANGRASRSSTCCRPACVCLSPPAAVCYRRLSRMRRRLDRHPPCDAAAGRRPAGAATAGLSVAAAALSIQLVAAALPPRRAAVDAAHYLGKLDVLVRHRGSGERRWGRNGGGRGAQSAHNQLATVEQWPGVAGAGISFVVITNLRMLHSLHGPATQAGSAVICSHNHAAVGCDFFLIILDNTHSHPPGAVREHAMASSRGGR